MAKSLVNKKRDDRVYTRRPEIEALIDTVMGLTGDDAVARFEIGDRGHPAYLPSEVLLHFLRNTRLDNSDRRFERLFRILLARVMGSVKAAFPERVYRNAEDMQNEVVSNLAVAIAKDRHTTDTKLDYYEVNFDGAIAKRKIDALRKYGPKADRSEPLMTESGSGTEVMPEVEEAAQQLLSGNSSLFDDEDFRFRLTSAIDALPDDEKAVIGLLQQGLPIDAKEGKVCIAKMLGCDERTVRNRRDRALLKLKKSLQEDSSS